jgi:hypothetical protein
MEKKEDEESAAKERIVRLISEIEKLKEKEGSKEELLAAIKILEKYEAEEK